MSLLVILSVAAAQIDAPLRVVLGAGAVAAALIPIGRVVGGAWRGVKRWDQRLAYIDEQMRHNGGGTLRDEVARCSRNIDRVAAALDDHLGIRVELDPPTTHHQED